MDPIADAMMELSDPVVSDRRMSFLRMVTCSVSEPRARFRRDPWPDGMYVLTREDDDLLGIHMPDDRTDVWRPVMEDISSDDWRRA